MDEKKEQLNASQLMDEIIAATFTRHTGMSNADFLKVLGCEEKPGEKFLREMEIEGAPDESAYVRGSIFTLICAAAREILRANNTLQLLNEEIKLVFNEEK